MSDPPPRGRETTKGFLLGPVLPAGLVGLALGTALALGASIDAEDTQCGPGFVARGPRCLVVGTACPAPLVKTELGCDAPLTRVSVPESTLALGPSDWEAEGRVAARSLHVNAFSIDAFEVTLGAFACPRCPFPDALRLVGGDPARAVNFVTRDEAVRFCASRGGRLPTEDEWIAAAAGMPPRRYPWGETGAVCRRAAWGLASGPCSNSGTGPDTVGAHTEGKTPLGIHDLAGNVAEWVGESATDSPSLSLTRGIVRGGSWKSALVTDLRTWARQELDPGVRNPGVGVRCAYDGAPPSARDR